MYARCAGIDVQKRTVVVTVVLTGLEGPAQKQTRPFGTMTADLLALGEWLEEERVTPVALESTGVSWWPVSHRLEEGCRLLLVTPQHLKTVPGRTTEVKDSDWLADLVRHGLLHASVIPPAPLRALRELTRSRKTLIRARVHQANRLQQGLASATSKLAAVASAVLGMRARQMLEALLAGEEDGAALADLARRHLRRTIPALKQALEGRLLPPQRFLLRALRAHVDFLDAAIVRVQAEMEHHVVPSQEARRLVQTIAGVNETAAAAIRAAIGTDMSRFPSAGHLASWAGVCPGTKQRGGQRLKEATTQGSPWLRAILGAVVFAIAHTRDT